MLLCDAMQTKLHLGARVATTLSLSVDLFTFERNVLSVCQETVLLRTIISTTTQNSQHGLAHRPNLLVNSDIVCNWYSGQNASLRHISCQVIATYS
jgi:hypothetical protein